MDKAVQEAFIKAVSKQPFAKLLGIRLVEVEEGRAICEMNYTEAINNSNQMAHGGAILALIDETLGNASNSYGTIAVGLNVSTTFMKQAVLGILRAEAKELMRLTRTATYQISVTDHEGMVAMCQALVYLTHNAIFNLR